MAVSLHHFHIAAPADLLDQVKAFYEKLFDLQQGPRPAFASRGFWLYSGDHALLHLAVANENACRQTTQSTIDHIALRCDDMPAMQAKITAMQLPFQVFHVPPLPDDDPALQQIQLFVTDPAGNNLELNFIVPR
ncbi:MAG: diguanylate cyclase [Burkholderiales bacterium]|nr:diguanylate cyclase [Burkholderiales bacterium]